MDPARAGLVGAPCSRVLAAVRALLEGARFPLGLGGNAIGLELAAPKPQEVEIVAPAPAERLLAAAPDQDRAIWATALYAGLRYGELQALRWGAVNLADGRIEVRESWDAKAGVIEPKTRTSRRSVALNPTLREFLLDHKLGAGATGERDLVFGTGADEPFQAATIYRRADRAWREAGIEPREDGRPLLRLHQARHTFASFMIGAGVNPKALSTIMGHSSIKLTYDLYGHLLPGAEDEAAALLETWLGEQRARAAEEAIRGSA